MTSRLRIIAILGAIVLAGITFVTMPGAESADSVATNTERQEQERKLARGDYFQQIYRNPVTGRIPRNVRSIELAAVANIPTTEFANKAGKAAYTFTEAGPIDVGGRTRAIVADASNGAVLLAGAAGGGIWRSSDSGATWSLVSEEFLTVTSIAQQGSSSIWYAATGEQSGTWGTPTSDGGSIFGTGIYRSADGGQTWALAFAENGNPISWDSPFDYITRIVASPTTGTVLLTDVWSGVWRSTDSGASWQVVLGEAPEQLASDIVVGASGKLWAAMVAEGSTGVNGLYSSSDDGATWSAVGTTPPELAAGHARSVLAVTGDETQAYILSTIDGTVVRSGHTVEDIRLYMVTLGTGVWDERSGNLPLFERGDGSVGLGKLDSQRSYNLTIGVHPTNNGHVFVGGTSVFRSRDGFATPLADKADGWIGGYSTDDNNSQYANNHPDQHALFFDPSSPNRLYNGHDGGVSVADDVTANGPITWRSLDGGYNVTQFFTVSIARAAGDARVIGGTQDNGSPFFRYESGSATVSEDVSTGDGAFGYIGSDIVFSSAQQGALQYEEIAASGVPTFQEGIPLMPCTQCGAQFVNPGAVDPVSEGFFYYPAGSDVYRWTRSADAWVKLASLPGVAVSALSMSTAPAGRLYVAGYSESDVPKFFRFDSANTSTAAPTELAIPGATAGAYILDIGINPADADQVLVTVSNYGVPSLFYSADGGSSWSSVEGNLAGANDQGPSIRAAEILPAGGDTRYFVGTSTGLYSAASMNGTSTQWTLEASAVIGNSPVAWMDARVSDGRLAVSTHGRGIFFGDPAAGAPNSAPTATAQSISVLEDATVQITLAGSDSDSDPLTFSVASQPSNGALSGSGGTITYDSNDNYAGADSFTFTANDGTVSSGAATVSIDVTPVNDAPSFTAGSNQAALSAGGAQSVTGWATQISTGPANESGQVPTFEVAVDQTALFSAQPSISADGTLTYTPATVGTATVTVTLRDDGGTANGGIDAAAAVAFTINITESVTLVTGAITFSVDMTREIALGNILDGDVIGVIGTEAPLDMTAITSLSDADGDGVYTGNVNFNLAAGTTIQYKFVLDENGGVLRVEDTVGAGDNGNRQLQFTGDESLGVVFWNNVSGVDSQSEELPEEFAIKGNYPNPFNPSTTLTIDLPETAMVQVSVIDLLGRVVLVTPATELSAGSARSVSVNASGLASGTYVYSIRAVSPGMTRNGSGTFVLQK